MNVGGERRTPAGSPVNAVRAIKKDEVVFAEPKAEEGAAAFPQTVQKVLFSALLPSTAQVKLDEILRGGLEFECDDVALTQQGRDAALQAADVISKHRKVGIEIVGYACSVSDAGAEGLHQRLGSDKFSLLRARSVREILLAAGCKNVLAAKGGGQNNQKGSRSDIFVCDPEDAALIEAEVVGKEDALAKQGREEHLVHEATRAECRSPRRSLKLESKADQKRKQTDAVFEGPGCGQLEEGKPTEGGDSSVCDAVASSDADNPAQSAANLVDTGLPAGAGGEMLEETPDRFFECFVSFAGATIQNPVVLQMVAAAVGMRPTLRVRLVGSISADAEVDAVTQFLGDLGVVCTSSSEKLLGISGVRCQVLFHNDSELRAHFLRGRRCGASVERSSPETLEIVEWLEASFHTRKSEELHCTEPSRNHDEAENASQILCVERELSGKMCKVTACDDRPRACVHFAAQELDCGQRHELVLRYVDFEDLLTSPEAGSFGAAPDIVSDCDVISEQLELVHNDFCGTCLELRRRSVILMDELTEETPKSALHDEHSSPLHSSGQVAVDCRNTDKVAACENLEPRTDAADRGKM